MRVGHGVSRMNGIGGSLFFCRRSMGRDGTAMGHAVPRWRYTLATTSSMQGRRRGLLPDPKAFPSTSSACSKSSTPSTSRSEQLIKSSKSLLRKIRSANRLMSIPGVGSVTKLRFVAAIDDVSSFCVCPRGSKHPRPHAPARAPNAKQRTCITKAGRCRAPRSRATRPPGGSSPMSLLPRTVDGEDPCFALLVLSTHVGTRVTLSLPERPLHSRGTGGACCTRRASLLTCAARDTRSSSATPRRAAPTSVVAQAPV